MKDSVGLCVLLERKQALMWQRLCGALCHDLLAGLAALAGVSAEGTEGRKEGGR